MYKAKVFSVERLALQALEDGDVDIALVDLRNDQTGENGCVVVTHRQTAVRYARAFDRVFNLQGKGFEHSASLFRFEVKGQTPVEVIILLKVILDVRLVSRLT